MDMSGERLIEASRDTVWEALNNPDILKACIPGCETIEKLSETEMKATAAVKLGPIAARFAGKVRLSDLDPPNGYTISGEGQGGVAGFAKGDAKVTLWDEAGATKLIYEVQAQVGGKMAQLGARLIDSTAKQYADTFFTKFSALVAPPPAPVAGPEAEPAYHLAHEDHDHDPSNPHYFGLPLGVILAAVVAVIAVGITLAKLLH
ncbi:MAG TPA: carbon monoxide dehydrogenase subunit G [Acidocella sp.]|jgi:carbon monoxide dehydrogenase subunit G|uniref:SRPBCC family protein n=1 Tax=Acidocella sp. TaxID=50710 RepID=UPI002C148089|nr:carbon monoxide dehydrogenase subunit G [Acidocella sp.]HVE22606.1 carbon monoxide dehydrogenase subunit G [Acidocella sp.]